MRWIVACVWRNPAPRYCYSRMAYTRHAEKISSRMDDFSFYVLGPDVAARGLNEMPLIDGLTVVDYEGFVDLVTETDVSQSWL